MNTLITMPRWPGAISKRSFDGLEDASGSTGRARSSRACCSRRALYSSAIDFRGMIVFRNEDRLVRPLHLDEEIRTGEAEDDADLVLVQEHARPRRSSRRGLVSANTSGMSPRSVATRPDEIGRLAPEEDRARPAPRG